MIYRVLVYDKKAKSYESKGNFKTRKSADKKMESFTKKNRDAKVVALPSDELKVGMKIYKADGDMYGIITRDDDCFWYVNRGCKDENDEMFFSKDSFLEKYENGTLIMKE